MHFESADAGASLTYPQQAGTVRKNGFLVIKGRPCKVRRTLALVFQALTICRAQSAASTAFSSVFALCTSSPVQLYSCQPCSRA